MVTKETVTLTKLREAIIYAAGKNPCSHGAELKFAERLKCSPHVLEAHLCRRQYVVKLLNAEPGSTLADLGCGNGVNSILSLMCGVGEVYAIEMEDKRFKTAQLIIDFLGLGDKIHLCKANLLEFNLPQNSIDGAFSAELLEHIADLPGLYRKLRVWLKTGRRVYARTGANGSTLIKRKTFKKTWNELDKKYQKQREEIISAKVPNLNAEEISVIAERTRGLLAEEIEEEAQKFMDSGELPIDRRPCAPRDPYTCQYMERLLNPIETTEQIDTEGFTTRVIRPDFSSLTVVNPIKRRAYWAMGQIIRFTHPLSLCVAPWLEFLSTKK